MEQSWDAPFSMIWSKWSINYATLLCGNVGRFRVPAYDQPTTENSKWGLKPYGTKSVEGMLVPTRGQRWKEPVDPWCQSWPTSGWKPMIPYLRHHQFGLTLRVKPYQPSSIFQLLVKGGVRDLQSLRSDRQSQGPRYKGLQGWEPKNQISAFCYADSSQCPIMTCTFKSIERGVQIIMVAPIQQSKWVGQGITWPPVLSDCKLRR